MTVLDLQSILLLAIRKFTHVLNVCSPCLSCAEDLQERTRTIDDCCYRCTYHNPSGDEDKVCELGRNRQLPPKYVDPLTFEAASAAVSEHILKIRKEQNRALSPKRPQMLVEGPYSTSPVPSVESPIAAVRASQASRNALPFSSWSHPRAPATACWRHSA